jgi:uncharacterized membrane protein
MNPWLEGAIPYVKALHIAALVIWCAGLFALPLMLARHDPAIGQADYSRIRLASHYGYTWVVTPAAMLAVAAGTLLIFLRELFVWTRRSLHLRSRRQGKPMPGGAELAAARLA